MSDLKLGQIITGPAARDAIHVAVAPIVAGAVLSPAERVFFVAGKAVPAIAPPAVGIVDPFLTRRVQRGETFWLFLFPGTITALRHEWTRPAFEDKIKIPSAKAVLDAFALQVGCSFESLVDVLDIYARGSCLDDTEIQRNLNSIASDAAAVLALWTAYEAIAAKPCQKTSREQPTFAAPADMTNAVAISISPAYVSESVTLFLGDCLELNALIRCNAVITDPPFSERTHAGHDACTSDTEKDGNDFKDRKSLGYSSWGEGEIASFCARFNPNGWLVVFTDHVLAPIFEREMRESSRYVFAPLPSYTPGRTVRLTGDGPSSWTDWLVVSRTTAQVKWGTLPGGYVNANNQRLGGSVIGGKQIGLMCRLVEDYSRPGDTVCDPCMGSGTTGIACLRTGRKFIGIEKDPAHFATALERIKREEAQGKLL